MNRERHIAGDWGTSRLRLSLCLGGRVVETRQGPGIGTLREPAAAALRPLIADWREAHGPLPLLLCGMAGSRNGWRETPYLPCPADLRALAAGAMRFEAEGAPVAIAPGLSCRSRLGSPDVMRGEETQIAGALALHPGLGAGRHLLCLPGTHTKWACLEDGHVTDFLTALTGELFALLRDGSTLMRAARAGSEGESIDTEGAPADAQEGFGSGLEAAAVLGTASLLHALFAVRSLQLLDGRSHAWARAYLSGLLIGADARGAMPLFGTRAGVVLIGDGGLNELYAQALRREGIAASCLDGEQCALAGLRTLWRP
ncbi:MAG TPA: 2-dehydro-3-deoxygalactonokinase [Steroidobacteraceae bacterium]|nr:2-dehydro-3-deoxygalactonokinase [Steroidobacteraceae bacterium]